MTRQGGIGLLVRKAEPIEASESELAEQAAADFVLEALREEQAKRAEETVHAHLASIPDRDAMALALNDGLAGYASLDQIEIAPYIGAASQQSVSYAVRRARARLKYLLTRPAIVEAELAEVLSTDQLETVRAVYETASFVAVARRRSPCPEERTGKARRVWNSTQANRVRREFFRALADVERAGLAGQVAALRHLVANLGRLHLHEGKGSWWTKRERRRGQDLSGAGECP